MLVKELVRLGSVYLPFSELGKLSEFHKMSTHLQKFDFEPPGLYNTCKRTEMIVLRFVAEYRDSQEAGVCYARIIGAG